MTQCWASSMRKSIRSVAFMRLGVVPVNMLAHSAVVIVCSVGQYDGGNEDIIIVLSHVSDKVKPIFIRFLCHHNIRSK